MNDESQKLLKTKQIFEILGLFPIFCGLVLL